MIKIGASTIGIFKRAGEIALNALRPKMASNEIPVFAELTGYTFRNTAKQARAVTPRRPYISGGIPGAAFEIPFVNNSPRAIGDVFVPSSMSRDLTDLAVKSRSNSTSMGHILPEIKFTDGAEIRRAIKLKAHAGGVQDAVITMQRDGGDSILYAYTTDGKLIGTLTGRVNSPLYITDGQFRKGFYICSLDALGNKEYSGIGTALIEEAFRRGHEIGKSRLVLHATQLGDNPRKMPPSVIFYDGLGFIASDPAKRDAVKKAVAHFKNTGIYNSYDDLDMYLPNEIVAEWKRTKLP